VHNYFYVLKDVGSVAEVNIGDDVKVRWIWSSHCL